MVARALAALTAAVPLTTSVPPVRGEINRYDATSGNLTATLPELAQAIVGERFTIQKSTQDTSSNIVTITAAGSDVFDDGATAFILRYPGDYRDVKVVSVSGVKKWRAIGGNLLTGVTDRNGNSILDLPATTSAVNRLSITNAATGTGPTISVVGSDTNADLNLAGKGTGKVKGLFEGRLVLRVGSTTSSATPTINTDNVDGYSITALAVAITSMTTNLSGTPTDFQRLLIRIKDNGSARAITWGASFEAGSAALPTTTVAGKTLLVGLIYDSVDSKWACEASASRA